MVGGLNEALSEALRDKGFLSSEEQLATLMRAAILRAERGRMRDSACELFLEDLTELRDFNLTMAFFADYARPRSLRLFDRLIESVKQEANFGRGDLSRAENQQFVVVSAEGAAAPETVLPLGPTGTVSPGAAVVTNRVAGAVAMRPQHRPPGDGIRGRMAAAAGETASLSTVPVVVSETVDEPKPKKKTKKKTSKKKKAHHR